MTTTSAPALHHRRPGTLATHQDIVVDEPAASPAAAVEAPRRHVRRVWLGALLAAVLMFGNYVVAVPVQVAFGALVPGASDTVRVAVNAGLGVVTLVTALVLVRLVAGWTRGLDLAGVGLRWTSRSLPMFLVGWATMTVATLVAQWLPSSLGLHVASQERATLAGMPVALAVAVVVNEVSRALCLQGIPEELVWRGWLMRAFADRPRTILAVSSLVFGALHYVSNGGQAGLVDHLVYCLQAAGFAFLASALALRLHSLWAAIGVHGGMHLTNSVLPFCGTTHADSTTWAVEALCCLAIGLVVLHGWRGDSVV